MSTVLESSKQHFSYLPNDNFIPDLGLATFGKNLELILELCKTFQDCLFDKATLRGKGLIKICIGLQTTFFFLKERSDFNL